MILAGSDRRPGPVPRGVEGYRFVVGYKGAEIRIGDRPLVRVLLDRLRDAAVFGEIYLAGPRRVYEKLVDCTLIDTDGSVSDNIRAAVDAVHARHGSETRIAFISCDVLPTAEEIAVLMGAMLSTVPEEGAPAEEGDPAALTLSLVRVDEPLGASAWKPKYRIRPSPGSDPVPFLPGHVAVARPSRLRLGLFQRLVQLAYQERNRDYEHRRRTIVLHFVRSLLWRDFLNVFRLAPPTLTYSVLRRGLGAFLSWRRGELSLDGLGSAIGAVLVRRKHYRRLGGRSVRLVVTAHSSFARDIDTHEEADELIGGLEGKRGRR